MMLNFSLSAKDIVADIDIYIYIRIDINFDHAMRVGLCNLNYAHTLKAV